MKYARITLKILSMNRKIKNKKFGKAFSQKFTTTVQQYVLSLYLSHSCKLQFIGESAMEAGLSQINSCLAVSLPDNICISNAQYYEPGALRNLWCEILEF